MTQLFKNGKLDFKMSPSVSGTVGILGCGWLGKALAIKFINNGFKVKGSTTSEDKLKDLEALGIRSYQIEFFKHKTTGSIDSFLENIEALVISIPPRYKEGDDALYQALKRTLKQQSLEHIQNILYVSSTGVFEDGEHCVYDEDSQPNAAHNKGKYLIQLEELFNPLKFKQRVSVLRLGGLLKDGGRHPIHHLAGRTGISNPDAPVNLIEQNDAVDLMWSILRKKEKLKPVYHGVYPWYPGRQEYYTEKAKELGLIPPEFQHTQKRLGKRVRSEKTSKDLNFTFKSKI